MLNLSEIQKSHYKNPHDGRELPPEAMRALAEAAERRAELDLRLTQLQQVEEINGRKGPEPIRYEDWEVKGIATDF